jgi:hypothetical protein
MVGSSLVGLFGSKYIDSQGLMVSSLVNLLHFSLANLVSASPKYIYVCCTVLCHADGIIVARPISCMCTFSTWYSTKNQVRI